MTEMETDLPTELSKAFQENERLRAILRRALPYLDNSDSPGGCDGKHADCEHCLVIKAVRDALAP
jgi:hypothetical protein